MEVMEEDEGEEMELGELDLDAIEEECGKKKERDMSHDARSSFSKNPSSNRGLIRSWV